MAKMIQDRDDTRESIRCGNTVSDLHTERLNAVLRLVAERGTRSILDLGCGAGALLQRLADVPSFTEIVGVDDCPVALMLARQALLQQFDRMPDHLRLIRGSYTDRDADLRGFDACAMIETIEHIPPCQLSKVEDVVFGYYRPQMIAMTTPNREFNALLGLGKNQCRHPDHQFEWNRSRFRAWGRGVAKRNRYVVQFHGIGEFDRLAGRPTQMAVFERSD